MKKLYTLAFLLKDGMICLAVKKQKLGKGSWNGYGGEVEDNESINSAVVREIQEESGVQVRKADLDKVAIIEFLHPDGKHLEVHTFFVHVWEGEPAESNEVGSAHWFLYNEIPYDHMWADDAYWLPRTLCGERIRGKVWFQEDGKLIEKMEWKKVEMF